MCVRLAAVSFVTLCSVVGATDFLGKTPSNEDEGQSSMATMEHSRKLSDPYDIVYVPVDDTLHEHLSLDVSAQYVDLSNIVVNNLGRKGPGSGPKELRYGNVLTASGGGSIDMVVTNLNPYRPKNSDNNGLNGMLGQINMKGGQSTDFLFRFVEAGTNESVTLNQLLFTFYDVDNAKQSSPLREELFCEHYEKAYLAADTSVLLVDRAGSDRPIFRSTVKDKTGFNNPDDPNNLSPAQRRHAVTFSFFAVSEIRVTFQIPNASPNNGRNFFFSGVPLFPACVNTTATVDLNITETEYVNLGGEGPDLSYPEGMRFTEVLTLENGTKVDMLVSVVDTPDYEFQSTLPWKNGAIHGFGRINMDRGHKAKFSLELQNSVTYEPVTVRNLVFSFMDLDSDITDVLFHERVIIEGFNKVYLANDTVIKTTDLPDGSTIFSSGASEVCSECNNPTDPAMLTPTQQARTVTLEFFEVSKFDFVVDFTTLVNESIDDCDGMNESYQLTGADTKCAIHEDRLFRIEGQTVESCYQACKGTPKCEYFSISLSGTYAGVCMGCEEGVTASHAPFEFYSMSMPCRVQPSSMTPYSLNQTDTKCKRKGGDRLFTIQDQTLESCYEECVENPQCNYFSFDPDGQYAGFCMGCMQGVTDPHSNFNFYQLGKRSRNIYFGGKTLLNNAEETEFCTK